MKHIESTIHARGETHYVDDLPLREGTLFGAVFDSPFAHGRITRLDTSAAEAMDGVVAVITHRDIPGENQIGSIIPDEELFAEHEVHYVGMPVALVVAEDLDTARAARKAIVLEIDELPPVFDEREARAKELFISPPRTFAQGSVDTAWHDCDVVVSGTAATGGQEHVYLETHGAYVWPTEDGALKVFSSTQAPWYVQKGIAKVLDLPIHKIEVDVARIGGGFGGKEDQGTPWATMTALAVQCLGRPVKLVLHRLEDIRMSGKRHPYSFDYRIGLTRDLKIRGWDVTAYQNAGASADVSPAVMERTLFHGCGSYFIPNARVTVYSCRTNLPVNTAFRGFGAPQAMYVMEAAITAAATKMGVDRAEVQRANLLTEGDTFHYGQTATLCNAGACWDKAADVHGLAQLRAEIDEFNRTHDTHKKGLALFPLALLHIVAHPLYKAHAFLASGGAVEQVAADVGIEPERIREAVAELDMASDEWGTGQSSTGIVRGGKLRFRRETEGEISEDSHQSLVDEIDSNLGIVGRISPFGRSLTWSPAAPSDEERNVVVKITPQDGRTRIHVEERVELSGWVRLVPVAGVVAGAAIGVLGAGALQASDTVMGLSALGLAIVGGFGAVRVVTWGICQRRRPDLEHLANRLAEIAAKSRWAE